MGSEISKLRRKLGITSTQLAYRLGLQQSTVVRLEQSEQRGVISLETLHRAAEAMECELVYSFVEKNVLKTPRSRAFPDRPKILETQRKSSRISAELKGEAQQAAATLTPEQRLKRTFELINFQSKMMRCLSKP